MKKSVYQLLNGQRVRQRILKGLQSSLNLGKNLTILKVHTTYVSAGEMATSLFLLLLIQKGQKLKIKTHQSTVVVKLN